MTEQALTKRPALPEVTCVDCGTVYFVSSEARLRAMGYDSARLDALRRCRCGATQFVPAKEGDAPELATLTAVITLAIDPQVVADYENWMATLDCERQLLAQQRDLFD